MNRRLVLAVLAIALTSVASLTGCGNQAPAKANTLDNATALEQRLYDGALKAGGTVSVWDTLIGSNAQKLVDKFQARYPGVHVTFYGATSDVLDSKFQIESAANKVSVDALATDFLDQLSQKGKTSSLEDVAKDVGLDPALVAKSGDGLALFNQVFGVTYNTNMVKAADVPRTWADLLNPKWKGKEVLEERLKVFIQASTAKRSVPESGFPKVWTEQYTTDYLTRLNKLQPQFQHGALPTLQAISSGAAELGVGTYYSATVQLAQAGQPVGWAPMEFVVLDAPSYEFVPKQAPNVDGGKLWLRWLASKEGQALIDQITNDGNPFPGTGTSTSQAFEKNHSVIVVGGNPPPDEFTRLQDNYRHIFGLAPEQ